MLILKRNNFLIHYKHKYRCAIGKNGLKRFKKEGDFCTPTGQFNLGPIYYRKDRINKLNTKLKIFPITKNMIWEDNPNNPTQKLSTLEVTIRCDQGAKSGNIHKVFAACSKARIFKVRCAAIGERFEDPYKVE